VEWVRRLRDEAIAADVPFFLKQLGQAHGKDVLRDLDGRTWDQFPAGFTK
jgi:protein gp37